MAPEAEEASIAESRRGQVGLLGEDVYMMPKGPFPLSPRGRGKGRADWVAAAHRGAALRRSPSTKGVWGPIIQRTVVRGRRLDIYAAMYKRTSARLFFFFFPAVHSFELQSTRQSPTMASTLAMGATRVMGVGASTSSFSSTSLPARSARLPRPCAAGPLAVRAQAAAVAAPEEERLRLNNLSPNPGSRPEEKRKGRGYGGHQVGEGLASPSRGGWGPPASRTLGGARGRGGSPGRRRSACSVPVQWCPGRVEQTKRPASP